MSGKPQLSPAKVKATLPEVNVVSKSPEIPVKNKVKVSTSKVSNGKLETSIIPDVSEIKSDSLKRKVTSTKLEEKSEEVVEVNVKRPKLEKQENSDDQNQTVKTSEEPLVMEKEKEEEKEESVAAQNTDQAPRTKKREKRPSHSSDDVWSRRRSERIFLHDAGVVLPSSLTYTNQQSTNNNSSSNSTSSCKSSKIIEPPKKKMTRKELGLKRLKYKEAERQNQVPLEMFLALRQCRLNEMGYTGGFGMFSGANPQINPTSSQDDSSGSEGDLPLSLLLQAEKRHLFVPELPPCQMHVCDLRDCQRVLMEEDGLYYAGYITAIQAPDVYGITLDRERGNRPHIFSREEMLEQTVKEVKPIHVKQIPEGTRVCAYWSQQYRCLYPGTVTKGNSEEPAQDMNTVFVEFDDGDSGRIPLEDVRLLLPDPDYEATDSSAEDKDGSIKDEATAEASTSEKPLSQIDGSVQENQCDEAVEENTLSSSKLDTLKRKYESKVRAKMGKNKSSTKDAKKGEAKLQTKKAKKTKSKSDKSGKSKSEEKLKAKSEKNKKKKSAQGGDLEPAVGQLASNQGSMAVDGDTVPSQLIDENGNCIKPKKVKNLPKIEGKKLTKLNQSPFVMKKPKHHFADTTSIAEKIKGFKKSRKNKGEGKNKLKSDKLSGDGIKLESAEGKVKKRKKHKTEHKHHHHHHKRHCHHHHKKHKRKNEVLHSSHPSSPVLTINVGTEPKASTLSSEEPKMEMPICCVSPGRSELSVKIKASPPSSTNSLSIKQTETLQLVTEQNETEVNPSASAEQNSAFVYPEKGTGRSNDKNASVKGETENKEAVSETKSPKKRKERKISCEKSKIAAFLPARQLWRWSGKSFKRPGTKGKAKKEYFKAITRGKETIRVGDCAVFLSTGRPHLPYVGSIETMWQSWGGNTVVKVKWFYHPEETKGGKKLAHPKGALFQSPHVDENDVQTISHKCEVLSWSEYQKWCEKKAAANNKGIYENEDVYYLAGNYEPLTKVLTLEPGVS